MSYEIDEIMQRCAQDPSLLPPADIDAIIDYERKALAAYDAGVKPKKGSKAVSPDMQLSLTDLGFTTSSVGATLPRPK